MNARSRPGTGWSRRAESSGGVVLLLSDHPRQTTRVSAVTHRGIARGIQFLWRNYRDAISIPDLAAVAGMSVRGFHKAFVKEIGRKPGDVLRGLRVQRVRELLADSNHTLKEIAARSGYRNENSLVVAFKRATGASPRKFQRRNA
jgi:LacI family transcriptional regulator